MSLNEDVRAALVVRLADLGRSVSDDVLDAISMSGDEDAATVAANARVRWEQWNGASPVNGIDADVVRRQMDVAGAAYLVWIDDRIVFFQTTVAGQSGTEPLTNATVSAVAMSHVVTIIQDLAFGQLLDRADGLVNDVIARQDQRAGVTTVPFVSPAVTSSRRQSRSGSWG